MTGSKRAATAAVELLKRFGVQYAFTVPGESFLGLLDALADEPSIKLVATRHEGGAAFMAEAVGKLTGIPAVCMATRGVGSSNLAIGIHTAQQDSSPLVAIVGQVRTDSRFRDAFQEVDLGPFLGHITKWSVEVPTSQRLPDLVSEALRRSVSGRPGPVALAVRADILDGPAPANLPELSAIPTGAPRAEDVAQTLDLLQGARRPLFVAGAGVLRAGATDSLVALAERTEIPVMGAFRRNDVFPNDHPLFLGTLAAGAIPSAVPRARSADVILAIGTHLGETTTNHYTLPVPGTKLIHIDSSPDVIGRSYPATVAMVADAGVSIRALLKRAADLDWTDRTAQNQADRREFEQATTPQPDSQVTALVDPTRVVSELRRQLPDDAVVTSDAGNFYSWLGRYYRFRRPGTFLGPTSGAMGYAVPAAVAASLVNQNRVPAVAVAGDGGFLMTANELAVAAQLGLNVTCVVLNNALYGTIRMHQERTYPGRVSGTELWTPDLIRFAEAFGGLGVRVDNNDDVADAVATVLNHRGVSILDVSVDRESIYAGQRLTRSAAVPAGEQ